MHLCYSAAQRRGAKGIFWITMHLWSSRVMSSGENINSPKEYCLPTRASSECCYSVPVEGTSFCITKKPTDCCDGWLTKLMIALILSFVYILPCRQISCCELSLKRRYSLVQGAILHAPCPLAIKYQVLGAWLEIHLRSRIPQPFWCSPYPPPRLRSNGWRGRAVEVQHKKPRKSGIALDLQMSFQ
jgi:hypothetical protein